jgi:hypothetical protein
MRLYNSPWWRSLLGLSSTKASWSPGNHKYKNQFPADEKLYRISSTKQFHFSRFLFLLQTLKRSWILANKKEISLSKPRNATYLSTSPGIKLRVIKHTRFLQNSSLFDTVKWRILRCTSEEQKRRRRRSGSPFCEHHMRSYILLITYIPDLQIYQTFIPLFSLWGILAQKVEGR